MWDQGYVSEVDYVYGYFGELSPARLKLALLARGIAHSIGPAPTYLELGFGQGLSLAINAAVSPGDFYGVDFNPAQVANARELADATGKTLEVFEESFEEFAQRTDLPQFDIIALHGVWSWVSAATRDTIVRIARERLRAGGILYISYNTMPGWSPAMPLRHLLHEYGKRGAKGGLLNRVEESIGFVESVIAADARYFVENPGLASRLATIRQQNRHYVSHEYFNREWLPMSFADVADMLAPAKLSYAASANIIDNLDGIAVPAAAVPILSGIADEALRQLTRDYFVSQQFRRDIFIKGIRHLPPVSLRAHILRQAFWRIGEECPKQITTAAGTADLRADIYDAVAAAIGDLGAGEVTVEAILRSEPCAGFTLDQVWEAVLVLASANYLAPAADTAIEAEDSQAASRLNQEILRRTAGSDQIQYLAAPRIGTALHVDLIEQMFLLAATAGIEPAIAHAETLLAAQGASLVIGGEAVSDPARVRASLEERFAHFEAVKYPLLKKLGAL